MSRKVFFNFNYNDLARAIIVRNSWVSHGGEAAGVLGSDDYTALFRKGDSAIQSWLDDQLTGTSVTAILVGANTFDSPWVKYVIAKSHHMGNGILAIDVSKIRDNMGNLSAHSLKTPKEYKSYRWNGDNGEENIEQWIEAAATLAGK